ncbi:PA2169 family four-helix-bundle protein [Hymenobacter sp. RP-2-7]|uniref:PA2169 family four-helix-bundle protein n=1 Tax=Hymenobacter polaris TaxID=2682546 RepID=A0A7Y0ABD5_9BACT|nr:PA2169 family four-helix-bundle protein [Hymenobacter polaris]NML64236.1 PA2169 family four-helix-bundle protein [Hymenobacter polaris]
MSLPEPLSDAADKAKDQYNDAANKAKEAANNVADKAKTTATDVASKAKDQYGEVADKAKNLYNEAADKAKDLAGSVPDSVKEASDKAVGAFNKLTTTQKIVGGALLAAGLSYLIAPKKKGKAKRKAKALDTLLLYVNDRVEGYKRAAAQAKDSELRSYYQELVSQSQQFASSLNNYLTTSGGKRETGTTLKGKLYRKLMDAQAAVTGNDEKAILAANVYGERWALKAYKKALRRKALKGNARDAVKKQFAQSKKTYKKLKSLAAQPAA